MARTRSASSGRCASVTCERSEATTRVDSTIPVHHAASAGKNRFPAALAERTMWGAAPQVLKLTATSALIATERHHARLSQRPGCVQEQNSDVNSGAPVGKCAQNSVNAGDSLY